MIKHIQNKFSVQTSSLLSIVHILSFVEELVDKEKREKLWEIYFNRTTDDCLLPAENLRIRNIEKQLALINRNRSVRLLPNPRRIRRRSSFDQQILERWKLLVEQCKTSEQLPWKLQLLLIRRHFRRHYKTILQP